MRKRTEPQISPGLFKKLLEFDNIDKGTKIYLPLDQKEVHWQHKVFTIKGIDNKKQVLIVTDADKKPNIIPFDELESYWVLINHVDSKYSHVKKTRKRRRYAE